jgi:hypothetical protein
VSFRIRPYDPSRKRAKRTAAQEAATQRNFRIFRLRSLWALAFILTEPRRYAVETLIDDELRSLGARTQREHEAALRAKWDKLEIDETDLPF